MKKIIQIISLLTISIIANCQVSKTINLLSAGTLTSSLTAEEKNTITDLTITGNIDASDIKCMRAEITNLKKLDLSNSTINAYNGTGGTISTVTSYPANEMPTYSFYSSYTGAKTSLQTIKMPNSLTSIGSYAFYLCTGLTGVLALPNSLISISDYAFYRCTGLTGTLTIPNSTTSVGNSTFYCCSGLTGLTLSNSLTKIGNYTFQLCYNMTGNLIIPNTLTSIGYSGFNSCKFTGDLILPNSLTTLMDNAFNGCSGFTSLTIPNSINSISPSVFLSCSGLTTATIGSSVNSIGEYAFSTCTSLKTINCLNPNPPSLGTRCFISVTPTSVYVPVSSLSIYKVAPGWSDYFSSVIKALNTALPKEIESSIEIFPNPFCDNLKFCGLENNSSLEIIDLNGRKIFVSSIENNQSISLQTLPNGVYIARIISRNGSFEKKIVKTN